MTLTSIRSLKLSWMMLLFLVLFSKNSSRFLVHGFWTDPQIFRTSSYIIPSRGFIFKKKRFIIQKHNRFMSADDSGSNEDAENKKFSTGRVGGRSPTPPPKKEMKINFKLPSWLVPLSIFLIGFKVFVQILFGGFGGGGNSNFVYYESSVYQTQTMLDDGKVETSRKESIKTNAPSLLNERQLLKQSQLMDRQYDRSVQSIITNQAFPNSDF
mmetsp:Transcript_4418/g.5109  ORF Transcript_4418/g.5109 Transcript_4418/m.5109 type:complete len:212 (+) Transcript_4418:146-781(+)|eukprot:CAMPEP_0194192608 /NCGR_PEP_ID=MMETSP0154-20130528/71359_1 /TAXON_ID=1049557 /ORGANISM="Thalassiothrix antarctica, Strain L6-D1" /LENGTH=211 /DNA_ID=CAMNT_0038916193 /DNA_START=121 /DNA_END=756 /DNA_ORIENTATION=+